MKMYFLQLERTSQMMLVVRKSDCHIDSRAVGVPIEVECRSDGARFFGVF